jgi:hypothetical protein
MPPLEISPRANFTFDAVLRCSSCVCNCLTLLLAVIFGFGSASAWAGASTSKKYGVPPECDVLQMSATLAVSFGTLQLSPL